MSCALCWSPCRRQAHNEKGRVQRERESATRKGESSRFQPFRLQCTKFACHFPITTTVQQPRETCDHRSLLQRLGAASVACALSLRGPWPGRALPLSCRMPREFLAGQAVRNVRIAASVLWARQRAARGAAGGQKANRSACECCKSAARSQEMSVTVSFVSFAILRSLQAQFPASRRSPCTQTHGHWSLAFLRHLERPASTEDVS